MPPKKNVVSDTEPTSSNSEAGKNFSWTPQNDRALLILAFGRNPTAEDYQKFVGALPAGASLNGLKIRYSKMRIEMRKRYEELGWEIPETSAGRTTPRKPRLPVTPKKRKGSEESAEATDEAETPIKAKKSRIRKEEGKKRGTKSQKTARNGSDGEVSSDDEGEECAVKEEDEFEAEI